MGTLALDPVSVIPLWADISAVVLGGFVGSLAAARAGFDINGALIAGIVTGLGGGIIRDVLLQQGPPVALTSPWLLPAAALAGLITFLFARPLHLLHGRIAPLVVILDALFLAEYTVVGTARGLEADLPVVSCIFLGVITGVGGGVLRDLLIHRPPVVLQPGTLEAGAAVIGAGVQVGLSFVISPLWALLAGIVVVAGLRILSVFLRWQTRPAGIADPPQVR